MAFADHLVIGSQYSCAENTRILRQIYQLNGEAASYCDSSLVPPGLFSAHFEHGVCQVLQNIMNGIFFDVVSGHESDA